MEVKVRRALYTEKGFRKMNKVFVEFSPCFWSNSGDFTANTIKHASEVELWKFYTKI